MKKSELRRLERLALLNIFKTSEIYIPQVIADIFNIYSQKCTKVKELRDSIKVAQEENNKLSAEKKNLEKANSEQKALIDTVKKMAENGNAQSAVEIKKYLSDKK